MPEGLHPREFEPIENRRKSRIQEGGLGSPVQQRRQYMCAHCHVTYEWTNDLDFTDFGDVIDNLCTACRKLLREMRTNHPPLEG
jgi:hypothetical protein